MAGNNWNEDITVQFVNEYVAHEGLWNTKLALYKNKMARLAAYKAIASKMNLPNFGEKEIVVKIQNIHSTYSQELKKIEDSKSSGSGDVYVPNLRWFSLLNSIKDDNDGETSFEDDRYNGVNNYLYCLEESAYNTFTEMGLPRTLKKRKIEELALLLTRVKEVCALNNAQPLEEHEFDIFGRSVGAQLKMMPLGQALQAQHYIQSYLTKIRLHESPGSVESPLYVEFDDSSP